MSFLVEANKLKGVKYYYYREKNFMVNLFHEYLLSGESCQLWSRNDQNDEAVSFQDMRLTRKHLFDL